MNKTYWQDIYFKYINELFSLRLIIHSIIIDEHTKNVLAYYIPDFTQTYLHRLILHRLFFCFIWWSLSSCYIHNKLPVYRFKLASRLCLPDRSTYTNIHVSRAVVVLFVNQFICVIVWYHSIVIVTMNDGCQCLNMS